MIDRIVEVVLGRECKTRKARSVEKRSRCTEVQTKLEKGTGIQRDIYIAEQFKTGNVDSARVRSLLILPYTLIPVYILLLYLVPILLPG